MVCGPAWSISRKFFGIVVALAFASAVLGCGSAEQKRDAFLGKAKQLLQEQKYADARFAVRNAMKVDPKSARSYALQGDIFMAEAKWQEAFKNYSIAAELDPNLPDANAGLAKLYLASGQLDDAARHIKAILDQDAQSVEGRTLQAGLLTSRKEFAPAKTILEPLVEKNPSTVDPALLLAGIYREERQQDKAIAVLRRSLQAVPDNSALLLRTAAYLYEQGELGPTEELLLKHVQRQQGDLQAQLALASFYTQSKQPQKAEALLRKGVAANPTEIRLVTALAVILEEQNRLDDALGVVDQGIQAQPKSYDMQLVKAEMLLRHGKTQQAQDVLEAVARGDGQGPKAIAAKRLLARIFASQGRYDDALATLAWVLDKNPDDPDANMLKGLISLTTSKPDQAVGAFRAALRQQPKATDLYLLLARAHFKNKEDKLGVEALQKALEVDPNYRPARFALADYYQLQDQWEKALGEIDSLRGRMDQQQVDMAKADIYFRWGKFAEARSRYEALAKGGPLAGVAQERLGRLEMVSKAFKPAAERFQKALVATPGNLAALAGFVEANMALKTPENAQAAIDQSLSSDPNPIVLELAARVALERGNFPKAEEYLKAAIAKDPSRPSTYQLLGLLYNKQNRGDKAMEALEQSLKAKPEDAQSAFMLGLMHHQRKDLGSAERYYQQALETQPQFSPASSHLAYLYAESTTDKEKLQKAVELMRPAADSEDPAALHALGWTYYKLGNMELAQDALMHAVSLTPYNPAVAYHAAIVLHEKGKNKQARAVLERGLSSGELFPDRARAEELLRQLPST